MTTSGTRSQPDREASDPWLIAWQLFVPLALWLLLAKTLLIMNALNPSPASGSGLFALAKWFWWFESLRMLACLLLGMALQRLLLRHQRWLALPIAVVLYLASAAAVALVKHEDTWTLLQVWTSGALGQVWGLTVSLWRDAISLGLLVSLAGLLLRLAPASMRKLVLRVVQLLVWALTILVGAMLVYQFSVGQPASLQVFEFAASRLGQIGPMLESETTLYRLLALIGAVLLPPIWFWWRRELWQGLRQLRWRPRLPAGATAALAAAIALPLPGPGLLQLLRFNEGELIGLAKTGLSSPTAEVRIQALRAFEQSGQTRWSDKALELRPTPKAKRLNVVLVMLESTRAKSSTLNHPRLQTMPFLNQLAHQGLLVEDMNAVMARTAAAWMAILTGMYPLTNEGTEMWARGNGGKPAIGSLPQALGKVGYATGFFSTTNMDFMSDVQVMHALHFQKLVTEPDLTFPGAERVTYFGIPDEFVVKPLLDWSVAQHDAGRPFFAAVMTNVGHHDFHTPKTWKKIQFEGVTDPVLNDYYNCLRYIDSVMQDLVQGYKRLGLLDDTVFIVLGDHGQLFSEHNAKQTYNAVYQEGLHIPALIYAPGLKLGPRRVTGPRQQIDVLPTVADLLGYRIEGARLPGVSLLQPVPQDRRLYFSSGIDRTFLAMREGHLKYIYSFGREPMQAFDLATDPNEDHPLTPLSQAREASLARAMLEWREDAQLSLMPPTSATRQALASH